MPLPCSRFILPREISSCSASRTVARLTDNAGEIGFDRVLAEAIAAAYR